ncbi:hypothetical protein DMW47_11090, partial [Serratia marcescens]
NSATSPLLTPLIQRPANMPAKAGRLRACTASTCHPFSRRRSRAWRRESASNTPRWARPSRSQAR